MTVPERKELGNKSLKLIHHRGPDQTNLKIFDDAFIGHCRLSIIDLEGSVQPMTDPSGQFYLAYNGELYNYKDIRERLKKSWEFKTQGDTEVLLAMLVLGKEELLNAAEGMWSFVFWDSNKKKLLISRDRMGKKPAYYSFTKQGIVVASELGALLSLMPNHAEEDLKSTADFIRYGYYLPGTTAYENVKEVLPGHIASWSNNNFHERPFWSLSVGTFSGSKAAARKKLRELFTSAVKKRMVADVEVGAFLSGGIDSSLLVSVVTEELNIKPKTFTIGFSNPDYDETQYARFVAEQFGTDHYQQVIDDFDIESLNDLIVNHVGQPFSDSSILPTSLVSKLASTHVKVALSGDGGDELFCGYQRYQARAILRWYTRLPSACRKNIEKLIKKIPEPFTHHSKSVLKKAHLFMDIVNRIECETPYIAPLMYTARDFRALAPDLCGYGHQPVYLNQEADLDDIQSMMYSDALVYLPQDILLKVDRASMAHSLETRAPFLDSRLVEFAFSVSPEWHRNLWKGKRLLHDAFRKKLPNRIWRRRKQGFAVPVHDWFRKDLGRQLTSMANDLDSPISRPFLRRLVDEHLSGIRDHGYRLWALYTYYLWKNQLAKNAS